MKWVAVQGKPDRDCRPAWFSNGHWVLSVSYLPTETRVNAVRMLREWHRTWCGLIILARLQLNLFGDKGMQDWMNLVTLICASLAALTLGVLAAYSCCRVAFAVLRMHAQSVADQRLAGERTAKQAAAFLKLV